MSAVDPSLVSLVSAFTALTASITGPLVTLYVARAQIRASVRSANRQKWIEEFRDTIAHLCGQIAATTQVREKVFKDGRVSISEEAEILREFERLIFTSTKVRLMINPLDREHNDLISKVNDVLILFRSATINEDIQDSAREKALRIVDVTLMIIRNEWARVQRGR